MTTPRHEKLLADLVELKLHRIAELYQEVLNEAARKQSSMLDVLATLIGEEVAVRRQRAVELRTHCARLPKRKTLAEYDFNFPKRIPKQAVLRLAVEGFWRVIRLGFRPLWLEIRTPYQRVSRCQNSEIACSRTCSSPDWSKGLAGSICGPSAN